MGETMGRRETFNAAGPVYFAVLVPHRDCRRLLRSLSAALFAGGFLGAWSFPHAAPLALLSRPLAGDELAGLARNLRRRSLGENNKGMILCGPARTLSLELPEGPALRLYGPALDLRIGMEDFGAGEKIRALFPPLLGCAVLGAGEKAPPEKIPPETAGTENPTALKFRAAAVANMRFRPLPSGEPGYSFSWRMGRPRWLPPCRGGFRPPAEGR
jgi:hypothetical protein